jgi:hypothetical protein
MVLEIKGKKVLIDSEDIEEVSKYIWRISPDSYVHSSLRVEGQPKRLDMRLHRLVMNAPKGVEVDHINGDKLDNRKSNLRLCNRWQNKANTRIISTNTTGYKGVSWHKDKWQASIRVSGKLIYLGRYATKEEAAKVYNKAATTHFGEFAWLNPLPDNMLGLI